MNLSPRALAACAIALAACGSREGNGDYRETSPPPSSPDGEILFKLQRGTLSGDAGGPSLPTDRDDLYSLARSKLAAGEIDEALAVVDTLLVLAPVDAELIEFRARALEAQGHPEDARNDFRRCCELERATCCERLGSP